MSGFFGAGGMGGNVERHIGDDDRDGAAIEAMRDAEPTSDDVSFQDRVDPWMQACFGAEISADKLAQVASLTPDDLIDLIGEFGREVYYLLDDCETSGPVGEEIHTITEDGLRKVSAILDRIEALPFEEPGVMLGTGAMLQAAIMQTFAHPPQPSEAVVEAAQALGSMPEGYCFCSTDRIGDDSKAHEPECADLRAALAAMEANDDRA